MQAFNPSKHGQGKPQNGVVLIVTLLVLLVLSILASLSIRGASSTEQTANQSRQKALAQQNAELALRFCEQQAQAFRVNPATGTQPLAAPVGGAAYFWETMSNWDDAVGPNDLGAAMPFVASGDADSATPYFGRRPECVTQYTTPGNLTLIVTTARGFGPEVVGPKDGNRPQGTEVWLQSLITMQ